MPRWQTLCRNEEEPTKLLQNEYFVKELDIKSGFGPCLNPNRKKDEKIVFKWNACWSCIPEEWAPAIEELVSYLKGKYIVETVDMNWDDPSIEVRITQVKDKFGSLRFYFHTVSKKIREDINAAINKCISQLRKDDPYYGIPY